MRKNTRTVLIKDKKIGGDSPILIQSMTDTKTTDINKTVSQILALEKEGCDIIRVAVYDEKAALAISEIKKQIHIPLVCDIHFDYKLAIKSIENGADKIRINPGNIGGIESLSKVIECAKKHNVAIRVGVNSGSLKDEYKVNGQVTAKGLCDCAFDYVNQIEKMGFENMVVSIKSSDTAMCVNANELFSDICDYPLHLGITEAGTTLLGSVRSTVGLTQLLSQGIGDTLRVSLTDDPIKEIIVARTILESLNLRKPRARVISCPTCGRTNIDLKKLACEVTDLAMEIDKDIKIAVMGCAVNGPGEASSADIGIAGGIGEGLLFKKGQIIKKLPQEKLLDALKEELLNL